jgi:hypothetical protein
MVEDDARLVDLLTPRVWTRSLSGAPRSAIVMLEQDRRACSLHGCTSSVSGNDPSRSGDLDGARSARCASSGLWRHTMLVSRSG